MQSKIGCKFEVCRSCLFFLIKERRTPQFGNFVPTLGVKIVINNIKIKVM
jgi:hypothetical protein